MKRFVLTRRAALSVYCLWMLLVDWREIAFENFRETIQSMEACETYEQACTIEGRFWRTLCDGPNQTKEAYAANRKAWLAVYDWKNTFYHD